jgi:hypothetical protein
MTTQEYNWHVRLVLDNEQDSQNLAHETAANAYATLLAVARGLGPDTLASRDLNGISAASDAMSDLVHDLAHGVNTMEEDSPLTLMATELVSAAMQSCDWREIAIDYLRDVRTETIAYVDGLIVHYGGDNADPDDMQNELYEQRHSQGMYEAVGAYDDAGERVATAIMEAATDTFGNDRLIV